MLKLLLETIESANGPVHVSELSQRLGIERSALEGMIAYWVQKGRLIEDDGSGCLPAEASIEGHCSSCSTDAVDCAFVAKMPRSYSIEINQ